MSHDLVSFPRRQPRARVMQPLREVLGALGTVTEGRSDETIILLAARELRAVHGAREAQARLSEQQAQDRRLRTRALPSSDTHNPWHLGAAVDVYELTEQAPWYARRGQGVIAERRVEQGKVVALRVSERGPAGDLLTRRKGSPVAWGNTDSRMFVTPAGAELRPVSARSPGKLKVFAWTEEESPLTGEGEQRNTRASRVHVRYVLAAPTLRELNIVLARVSNEWPHVTESVSEADHWALETPLTLFKSAQYGSGPPPTDLSYTPETRAERGKAWILLRRAYGG